MGERRLFGLTAEPHGSSDSIESLYPHLQIDLRLCLRGGCDE